MSTRCQVIVKDQYDEVWFYRHSDGYPEGATPTLIEFMNLVKAGKIRNNAGQASGWLVLIGSKEYAVSIDNIKDWKVGAYEPCSPVKHGDIEYLYTLDLEKLTITVKDIYENTESQITF